MCNQNACAACSVDKLCNLGAIMHGLETCAQTAGVRCGRGRANWGRTHTVPFACCLRWYGYRWAARPRLFHYNIYAAGSWAVHIYDPSRLRCKWNCQLNGNCTACLLRSLTLLWTPMLSDSNGQLNAISHFTIIVLMNEYQLHYHASQSLLANQFIGFKISRLKFEVSIWGLTSIQIGNNNNAYFF